MCVCVCVCGALSHDISMTLQGLCVVLENRMSHHLMKRILPLIHLRIHDTSEKVRLAFLDLLLVVKGLGTIKFWSICPVEHLLGK